jgi:tRNA threonylcarbamoyladenosine biosynthesis protein TsaE
VPAETRVTSPTFTLANEHVGRERLTHIDLYRLQNAAELESIGLHEYLESGAVVAVEWFDRFPDLLPLNRVDVTIAKVDANTRQIALEGRGTLRARIAQLGENGETP